MVLSDKEIQKYMLRLLKSRMRILVNHGFYGLLLMHMIFSLDEDCPTAYTDGERIAFSPKFIDQLSDSELDFVMMHEILHVVLQHCLRGSKHDDHVRSNIAADIVVNSNILLENNMNLSSISLRIWHGSALHLAPDGNEGYLYTMEEVYEMLPPTLAGNTKNSKAGGSGASKNSKAGGSGAGKNSKAGGSDASNNSKAGGNGTESGRAKKNTASPGENPSSGGTWDDHSKWGNIEEDSILRDVWVKRMADACESIRIKDAVTGRGTLPAFAERFWKDLTEPQLDWRIILNEFIQEEINDYSFSPPDRRFEDSPFFLPDLNEKGPSDKVADILFMIDTSGSMSDDMITAAYSEIKGAIDQFDGKLQGWLGFFDAAIIEPIPFEDEEEFKVIKPYGGGGTNFQIIFEYVHSHMEDNLPASIIILTDGYAPFPKEELAMGIPVLWLLNNEEVDPLWGKVARIKV